MQSSKHIRSCQPLHQENISVVKMATKLKFIFFILFLALSSCSTYKSTIRLKLEKELPLFNEILVFLINDSARSCKEGFFYFDSIKDNSLLHLVKEIKAKELLTFYSSSFPSSIYVGGKYCVIFFIKKERHLLTVDEHLLVYTGDSAQELSCIGSLYGVYREEEVNRMTIEVSAIRDGFSYVKVHHGLVTGL